MPGIRMFWTNTSCPVAMAGMSTRGTDVPSTVHSAAGLRAALAFSAMLNFLPPTSSPYETLFDGSLVAFTTPSATAS